MVVRCLILGNNGSRISQPAIEPGTFQLPGRFPGSLLLPRAPSKRTITLPKYLLSESLNNDSFLITLRDTLSTEQPAQHMYRT